VDVSSNNLGPEGKAAIGNALLRNLNSKLGFMNCDEWQLHEDMTTLNVANKQLTAEDAVLLAGVLAHNKIVTQVEASNCGMGTAAAKAFGDVLRVNKTLQHLNVSNNSFGKMQVGDQVKLKFSGEMKTVTYAYGDGYIKVEGVSGLVKPSEFEWESQVPAFCAGLAASSSLLSVSDSMWCNGRLSQPFRGAGW